METNITSRSFRKLDSLITLPVINSNGQRMYPQAEMDLGGEFLKHPLKIDIRNTAWAHYFPGEPVVVVDQRLSNGLPPETIGDLVKEIEYDGRKWRGDRGWGSSIKGYRSYGMTRDIPVQSGIFKFEEDRVRVGRWLLFNAYYGAGIFNGLKVRIVPRGTTFGNHMIHDGHGLVSRKIAEAVKNQLQPKIVLGKVADSFQVAQRLPTTPEVMSEVDALVQKRLDLLRKDGEWAKLVLEDQKSKLLWTQLDTDMLVHPFVTNAVTRSTKKTAMAVAASVPLNEDYRVVIPGDALSRVGRIHLGRYPMQAKENNRAFDTTGDARSAELEEWVKGVEVIQYTLTNPNEFFAKGTMALTDEDLGGADVVICVDDVKLAADKDAYTGQEWHTVNDCYFGIGAWWSKGSAVTVPYEQWSRMSGDFDGDGAVVGDLSELPHIFNAIADLGEQPAVKLKKTKTPVSEDGAARVMLRAFESAALVGMATNVLATLLGSNKPIAYAAKLGFTSVDDALDALNHLIQVGTDGFKTNADTREAKEKCMDMVQHGFVPWAGWKRSDLAFVTVIPEISDRGGVHINGDMTAMVPRIAKMTLPVIKELLTNMRGAAPMDLVNFRDWAVQPEEWLLEDVKDLNRQFYNAMKSLDWTDEDAHESAKAWLDRMITGWKTKRKVKSNWVLANALWWGVHNSKSKGAGAIVFWAFPNEAAQIIMEKPGLKVNGKPAIKVLGLGKHFDVPPMHYRGPVRIERQVVLDDRNRAAIRGFLCADLPIDHPNAELPDNTIGTISNESWVPEPGDYFGADLTQVGDSMWLLTLS
jgi:hypothetical protein